MRRDKSDQKKIVSYAYVGRYTDGSLGWQLPHCLSEYDSLNRPHQPTANEHTAGKDFELCKITIEVVPGRRKRKAKASL